jgi:hypothetical protein
MALSYLLQAQRLITCLVNRAVLLMAACQYGQVAFL